MRYTLAAAALAASLASVPALAADPECAAVRARFTPASPNPSDHYGMAYCAAREGQADAAFGHLNTALERGYRNVRHLRSDPDFNALHADARWAGAVAAAEAAEQRWKASVNPELFELYTADQGDRRQQPIDWAVVTPRDKARQARVRELAEAGVLKSSADYYHAAMVYQHGSSAEFHEQAHKWAKQAVELDASNMGARWLAAAAEDRWLHNTGKPQVWGTQFRKPAGATAWTMEPIDRVAKTDEERRAWGVPPLAENEARMQRMNALAQR